MEKILFATVFAVFLISGFTFGFADGNNFDFFVWLEDSELTDGDNVKIAGKVNDNVGNPIENAKVEAVMPEGTISNTTNHDGEFFIASQEPAKPGHYMSSVIVTVEDQGIQFASLTYDVKGKDALQLQNHPELQKIDKEIKNTIENIPKVVEEIPSAVEKSVTKNPLSDLITRQIQDIEKQNQEKEQRLKEINETKKFLDEQRELAEKSLEKDLQSFEKVNENNTPRNAFERFVEDVDESVRGIFWGQFELTEKISNDAHDAKMNALDEGETPKEAMKIFQRKAGISRTEIVEHNKELNIKYGFAEKKTQDLFDELGKFLRFNAG